MLIVEAIIEIFKSSPPKRIKYELNSILSRSLGNLQFPERRYKHDL